MTSESSLCLLFTARDPSSPGSAAWISRPLERFKKEEGSLEKMERAGKTKEARPLKKQVAHRWSSSTQAPASAAGIASISRTATLYIFCGD